MTDIDYLRAAYQVAMQSLDPSTQTGAVLVDDFSGLVVLGACNDFPSGVSIRIDRLQDRDTKLEYVEHAERAVIFKAVRNGHQRLGTFTLYATWAACAPCARAIIACGVKRLVAHYHPAHDVRPEWQRTIQYAKEMFAEAGVSFREVSGKIGGVKIRFNKQEIEP